MAQYMYFKYFAPYLGKAAIDANDALVETAGEIKKDPQGSNVRIRPLCSTLISKLGLRLSLFTRLGIIILEICSLEEW